MSIYQQPILIHLSDSNIFVMLQTYDPQNGCSQRFCLSRKTLANQIDHTAEGVTIESDLQNFCSVALVDTDMTFVVYWLHGSGKIQGYQQTFSVPVNKIKQVLSGGSVRHLHAQNGPSKARLVFQPSAHEAIAGIAGDKLKQHALRRFLRDNLNYGLGEELLIERDTWVKGFYFWSPEASFDGGIVLHETTVIGKDKRPHRKLFYSVHS